MILSNFDIPEDTDPETYTIATFSSVNYGLLTNLVFVHLVQDNPISIRILNPLFHLVRIPSYTFIYVTLLCSLLTIQYAFFKNNYAFFNFNFSYFNLILLIIKYD